MLGTLERNFMKTKKNTGLDIETKKAWDENWRDVSVEEALEAVKYPRVQEHIEMFKPFLSKDGKALEGGCGLGTYLIHFKDLGYDIIGVDYNVEPLTKIARHNGNIPLYCADVQNLPFKKDSFKAYLSLGVVEHFSEGPDHAINEAYRVLSPGGYFLLGVPRSSIFQKVIFPINLLKRNKFVRKFFKKEPKRYYWEQYFKIPELTGLLKKRGFEIVRMTPVDHEHSLMAFCGFFRDKKSYDGANKYGTMLGEFCKAHMPWITAASLIIICKKNN